LQARLGNRFRDDRRRAAIEVDNPAAPAENPCLPLLENKTVKPAELETIIDEAFADTAKIGPKTKGKIRKAVDEALDLLDAGKARVAEKQANGDWKVNQWLKKAVLLSFRLNDMATIKGGPGRAVWWDKVPSKFDGWKPAQFRKAGFRAVPGAIVRRSAYIAPGAVLMPSFVNLGAHVGENTMIDTWATVGSCAQIGSKVHISGGAGIGGVLEPLQAGPVVIEDNCFVGARAEVAEGVIVREGSVLSMGVFLGASTKIVDRETGKIHMGEVPPYSVVVPGTLPSRTVAGSNEPGPGLYCAVIVKRVDEKTRSKTSINELLRD
jgi:2,3,4,5-tetrahydropyridine-2-carboxylate N-succinyltransferase